MASLRAALRLASIVLPLAAATAAAPARAAETVNFTIDAARNVTPISRYIYGINSTLTPATNLTMRRMGGNRWTAYNWVNNASNAGSDYIFQNDGYLGGGNTPGGALIGAVNNAKDYSAALLVTVQINGYVAADKKANGDVRDSGPNYLKTRFHQERAVKGSPFTLSPSPATKFVYQDEFVNWVKQKFPYSQQAKSTTPIWFCLDNEPDLWAETHLEVHPSAPTYAELVSKGSSYAQAIKAVAPKALVFGPVSYGWYGYTRLQGAPDANNRDFLLFYLRQMKAKSATAGKRLLDVLDLHWYPEVRVGDYHNGIPITGANTSAAVVAARVQAPRSLWDPTYVENSWITKDDLGGAIKLIPRMLSKIASGYPGTRLAFTEYNYGAGKHISGGIAQADVLGIFGRDGVFAATQFALEAKEPFVQGAFMMYRNFDGHKGSFGDTSVSAKTSNVPDTSVYASRDSKNPTQMVIVAINKTAHPITGVIALKNAPAVNHGAIYQLTAAAALPKAKGTMVLNKPAKFTYVMPAYSVSTLKLTKN